MSVLIRGMEMPESCDTCFLSKWDTCNERFYCMFDDCPLVEVPEPYGEHLCEDEVVSCIEGADWINEVIRIFLDLQAEGSENDERVDDWTCDGCKHRHVWIYAYPCSECHEGSEYTEEGSENHAD